MKSKISLLMALIMAIALFMPNLASASDAPSPWAKTEVDEAIALGIVMEALQSDYQANITRGDFCAVIMALVYLQDEEIAEEIDLPENPFYDTNAKYVVAAYALGIVTGKTNDTFAPSGAIMRQEAAAMLTRAANVLGMETSAKPSFFADSGRISEYAKENVDFVFGAGIMKGTGNAMFDPAGYYSREQAYMTALRLYNALNDTGSDQIPVTQLEVRKINASSYGENIIFVNGFIYYINEGNLYKAPVYAPDKAEIIHMLIPRTDEGFASLSQLACSDIVYLHEHIGGASMGSPFSTLVFPDGSIEEFGDIITAYTSTADYDIVIAHGAGFGGIWSYMQVRTKGESGFKALGEEGYLYGMFQIVTESYGGYSLAPDFTVIGSDIYIVAQYRDGDNVMPPGLYKVNVPTGKTERVFEEAVYRFKAYGDIIYFIGKDNLLYKAVIGETRVDKVSDEKMNDFFILGDDIYYTAYVPLVSGGGDDANLIVVRDSLLSLSGKVLTPPEGRLYSDIHHIGSPNGEGYYAMRVYFPKTDSCQGFVLDEAGNVYKSDPKDNIEFIAVYNGVIWEFRCE